MKQNLRIKTRKMVQNPKNKQAASFGIFTDFTYVLCYWKPTITMKR